MWAGGPWPSDALAECLHQRQAHIPSPACPKHLPSPGLRPCHKPSSHLEENTILVICTLFLFLFYGFWGSFETITSMCNQNNSDRDDLSQHQLYREVCSTNTVWAYNSGFAFQGFVDFEFQGFVDFVFQGFIEAICQSDNGTIARPVPSTLHKPLPQTLRKATALLLC